MSTFEGSTSDALALVTICEAIAWLGGVVRLTRKQLREG